MKKMIVIESGETREGQVCPCHRTTIWPASDYDAHIERVRQIREGEINPYAELPWRKRNNDRISRWKKRKEDLANGIRQK